jgi:ammonia channel protein AmtB
VLTALALALAFLVALALGTFTRRTAVTAFLLMGLFVGLLALLAGAGRTLLLWGPALGLVAGLVLESIRDTARSLRPRPEAPPGPRQAARRAATRRAA